MSTKQVYKTKVPSLKKSCLLSSVTFYNLALFYIYGNDGTTISRRGVIINLKKYH